MSGFLTPVLALIVWTMIIAVLMYWRRIPAMNAITKDTQEFIRNPKLGEQLPEPARWAADNYNHLHESPVIFYALMFYLAISNQGDDIYSYLAWAYVAIRIVHSLVQVTSNKVLIRFSLFALTLLIMIIMALRALTAIL